MPALLFVCLSMLISGLTHITEVQYKIPQFLVSILIQLKIFLVTINAHLDSRSYAKIQGIEHINLVYQVINKNAIVFALLSSIIHSNCVQDYCSAAVFNHTESVVYVDCVRL